MPRISIILIIGIIALVVSLGSVAVHRHHLEGTRPSAARGALTDTPPSRTTKSRIREAPDLSPEALCGRIAKSLPMGSSDGVYQSIRGNLRHLSADEILTLLGQLDATACRNVRNMLEVLLLDLLAKKEPSLTADYLLANCGASDIYWDAFSESFFMNWVHNDFEASIAWLDGHHRNPPNDGSIVVIVRAETSILSKLVQNDPQAALDRLLSFPSTLSYPIIDSAFRRNSHLLNPDQAIGFLRDGLGRENHEALVGYVCGVQLYSKGPDGLRDFFREHEATLPEREAIIREAFRMEVNMGYGGDTDAFLRRSRAFAEQEGPGALHHITAVILGVISDRDREDRKAVDMLLDFNPDDEALRTFLEERGKSIDETQRLRIQERLGSD